VQSLLKVLAENSARARRTIAELARILPDPAQSPATRALENAVITARQSISAEARAELGWLVDRYLT
jgi:hypothetical protein